MPGIASSSSWPVEYPHSPPFHCNEHIKKYDITKKNHPKKHITNGINQNDILRFNFRL